MKMEFNLIRETEIEFKIRCANRNSKERKVESITRVRNSSYSLILTPVLDENGTSIGYGEKGSKSYQISSELVFGNKAFADQLKRGWPIPVTAQLTLSSSNTGRLKIVSKATGGNSFEGLYKLQQSLPLNSVQFVLSLENFTLEKSFGKGWRFSVARKLDFQQKGLKLIETQRGLFSLETGDLQFPGRSWWVEWRDGRAAFTGSLQLNLKLESAAVIELYKRRFGKESLAPQVKTPTDTVILVGGNEDKEQGFQCHKSILTEMSSVFETMFQADMVEKKEGILRIVEFSEPCVRAMIEFGYRRNLEEALKSSEMAVELLQASHMYQMTELMDLLLQIILSMPFAWFSADAAIKLFFFARNAGEDLAEAEKNGGMALKWYAKKFPEKLMESPEYVSLCENPAVMMNLGLEALKNVPSSCVIT